MAGVRLTRPLVLFLLVLCGAAIVAVARAATSVVEDATGDATPAYLDIVKAKITEQLGTGRLFFLMEVADAVPKQPSEAFLGWNWGIHGTNNVAGFTKYVVVVRWNGGHFEGFVVDRRPLLSGGRQIFTPIPFSVDGATLKAYVEPAQIGDPATLYWHAISRPAPAPAAVDFAPNGSLVTFTR